MTLIVTVNGPDSIWLLADRRLTSMGHVLRDDARKVMFLETTDGVAILGYAGLGMTAAGTEPCDWMSSVLRGRKLPLERCLEILADSMERKLRPYLSLLPTINGPTHNVLITAFLEDEARLYSIDIAFTPDRKNYKFRHTRHVLKEPGPKVLIAPRVKVAGSGGHYLNRNHNWVRPLMRIVSACDRGRVSVDTVATHLANLNNEVHAGVRDGSVGQRCIVAWRYREHGGGQQFFTGIAKDPSAPVLPAISNGMDVRALYEVLRPHSLKSFEAFVEGRPLPELDTNQLNEELGRLPDKPDEELQ